MESSVERLHEKGKVETRKGKKIAREETLDVHERKPKRKKYLERNRFSNG